MEWRVVFPFGSSRTVGEKTGERTATLGSFEEWTKYGSCCHTTCTMIFTIIIWHGPITQS